MRSVPNNAVTRYRECRVRPRLLPDARHTMILDACATPEHAGNKSNNSKRRSTHSMTPLRGTARATLWPPQCGPTTCHSCGWPARAPPKSAFFEWRRRVSTPTHAEASPGALRRIDAYNFHCALHCSVFHVSLSSEVRVGKVRMRATTTPKRCDKQQQYNGMTYDAKAATTSACVFRASVSLLRACCKRQDLMSGRLHNAEEESQQ